MRFGLYDMRSRGFTLMEIMITIIVISIISIFALPRYVTFIQRMNNGEAHGVLLALLQAEITYKKYNGSYTSTLVNLEVDIPALKHFKNISLNTGNAVCGGTSLPVLAQLTEKNDSYDLMIRDDGVIVCSCGVALCQNMGYPAVW